MASTLEPGVWRPWASASPSQVTLFRRCKRAWYHRHILGRFTPQTAAQARGTAGHAEIESYLLTGKPIENPYVQAVLPYLPKPGTFKVGTDVLVEHKYEMASYEGGPLFRGILDLAQSDGEKFEISDYKTTSDLRYKKTPEELRTGVQLNAYAWWVFSEFDWQRAITVRHYNILFPGPTAKAKPKPKVVVVEVSVTRDSVEQHWQGILETLHEMEVIARHGASCSADDVEPNTEACGDYGGCPYRGFCGLNPKKEIPTMELLKKIQMMKGTAAVEAPAARAIAVPETVAGEVVEKPPTNTLLSSVARVKAASGVQVPAPASSAPAVPASTSTAINERHLIVDEENVVRTSMASAETAPAILPPDAPPRETTPAEANAIIMKAEKKGKTRDKAAKEAVTEHPAVDSALPAQSPPVQTASASPLPTPTSSASAAFVTASGFTLYVDCYPVKGKERPVLLEEWIAPFQQQVARVCEVPDFRMVPYDKKGLLAAMLRDAVTENKIPTHLWIASHTPGAEIAVEALAPHAREVIRGIRG